MNRRTFLKSVGVAAALPCLPTTASALTVGELGVWDGVTWFDPTKECGKSIIYLAHKGSDNEEDVHEEVLKMARGQARDAVPEKYRGDVIYIRKEVQTYYCNHLLSWRYIPNERMTL